MGFDFGQIEEVGIDLCKKELTSIPTDNGTILIDVDLEMDNFINFLLQMKEYSKTHSGDELKAEVKSNWIHCELETKAFVKWYFGLSRAKDLYFFVIGFSYGGLND